MLADKYMSSLLILLDEAGVLESDLAVIWVAVYGVYYRIYVSIYCIYGAGEIYVPYMGLYIWGRSLGQSVSQSVITGTSSGVQQRIRAGVEVLIRVL